MESGNDIFKRFRAALRAAEDDLLVMAKSVYGDGAAVISTNTAGFSCNTVRLGADPKTHAALIVCWEEWYRPGPGIRPRKEIQSTRRRAIPLCDLDSVGKEQPFVAVTLKSQYRSFVDCPECTALLSGKDHTDAPQPLQKGDG